MIDHLISLCASPHLIDVILVLTLLEAIAVVACGGVTAIAMARMLLPGVFLLLALRAALAGAAWPWIPASLAASLLTHIVELRSRWKR